jgi:flagellar protein FliJ
MKARDQALKLKRFDVAEKGRKAGDLEMMVRDFEAMILDLERQISTEEDRTGVKDATHFAYSTFAKAAAQRRENLITTIADLRVKLDTARAEHEKSLEDLKALEVTDTRDTERPRTRTRGRARTERTSAAAN